MLGKKGAVLAVIAATSLTGGAGAANEDIVQLNPIVVTAQRMEVDDLQTPAAVTVITGDKLKQTAAASVYEALTKTIGISLRGYDAGFGSRGSSVGRVYVRGLDKGTLVMVNGMPLNQVNYADPGVIPMDAVDRIEIVKGSNSTLYGAEAMGGVINIITKESLPGQDTKVTLTGGIGNQQKLMKVGVVGDKFIFSAERNRMNEYKNAQVPYGRTKKASETLAKLAPHIKQDSIYSYGGTLSERTMDSVFASYRFTPELTLNYSHQRTDSGMDYPSLTEPGKLSNDKGVAGYRYRDTRDLATLSYRNDSGFRAAIGYNTKKVIGWQTDYNNVTSRSSKTSNYRVTNFHFDMQQEWALGDDALLLGLMAYREQYKMVDIGHDSVTRDQFAVFGQYNWQFDEKMKLTLGLRGHFSKDNGWDRDQKVLLPQLSASYQMAPNLYWFANMGKSFEMPAINSKYSNSKAKSNRVKPQHGWTYETGFKLLGEDYSLKASAFYMDIENMFAWEQYQYLYPAEFLAANNINPQEYEQINRGDFTNKGIEFEYRQFVGNGFDWYVGATYQDPKNQKKPGAPKKQIEAKTMVNAGFNWRNDKWSWSMDLFVEGKRQNHSRAKLDFASQPLPARINLNSTIAYQPTTDTTISLALRNILNRENYELYLWKDRPRSVMLSVSHTF